jgi:hypothetical protein
MVKFPVKLPPVTWSNMFTGKKGPFISPSVAAGLPNPHLYLLTLLQQYRLVCPMEQGAQYFQVLLQLLYCVL